MKPPQSQHNHIPTLSYFNRSTLQHPTNTTNSPNPNGQSAYIIPGTYSQNIQYDKLLSYEKLEIVHVKDNPVIIGRGALSTVYLAKSKKHNQHYVVKEMKKKLILETLGSTMPILNEMDIHSRITHRNIIKVFNVQENNDSIRIILEYGSQGSLYQMVKRRRGLSERKAFDYFIQAAAAVHFLHLNNIIHRDVKPENFVIGDDDQLKLCDFGWANKIYENTRDTICGTVEYMAPEIFNREHYDKSIDIWSLGVLLYEIIHDHSPFNKSKNSVGKNYEEIISNIKMHNYTFDKGISKDCEDIIRRMLEKDPKKRITIDEIFTHPFVVHYEKILVGNSAVEHCIRNNSCMFNEPPDIKRQLTSINLGTTSSLAKHMGDKPKKIKHIASFLLSDTIDWDDSPKKKANGNQGNSKGNIMKVNTVKSTNRLSFKMQLNKDKDITKGCNTPKKFLSINTNFNNESDDENDETVITPVKTMSVKLSDMFRKNFKESTTTLLDTSSSLVGENDKSHNYA